MKVSMIAAMTAQRVIGTGQGIPWHLPRDSAHFRSYTAGKFMLLGRRTYEEMIGWFTTQTPIVLTRDARAVLEGAPCLVTSVEEAVSWAAECGASELVVSGGAQVYRACLPVSEELNLTLIDADVVGAAKFPEFQQSEVWECVHREAHPADAENAYALEFQRWLRK